MKHLEFPDKDKMDGLEKELFSKLNNTNRMVWTWMTEWDKRAYILKMKKAGLIGGKK